MCTSMGGKTTKYTLQHNMINKKTEEKKNKTKKGRKTKVRREFFFRTYL